MSEVAGDGPHRPLRQPQHGDHAGALPEQDPARPWTDGVRRADSGSGLRPPHAGRRHDERPQRAAGSKRLAGSLAHGCGRSWWRHGRVGDGPAGALRVHLRTRRRFRARSSVLPFHHRQPTWLSGATFASDDTAPVDSEAASSDGGFACDLPALPLVPGRYRVDVEVHGRAYLQDSIEAATFFEVEQGVLAGRPWRASNAAMSRSSTAGPPHRSTRRRASRGRLRCACLVLAGASLSRAGSAARGSPTPTARGRRRDGTARRPHPRDRNGSWSLQARQRAEPVRSSPLRLKHQPLGGPRGRPEQTAQRDRAALHSRRQAIRAPSAESPCCSESITVVWPA